jgi:hypothetical protein
VFNRIVLAHSEFGIYLGSALGLGFWTKLDSVGQMYAVAFDTKEQAIEHVDTWDKSAWDYNTIEHLSFVDVLTENAERATMQECEAAGLDAWTVEGHS